MSKIIEMDSGVLHWSDRNCLVAIQFKDKTIAIGVGMLPFFDSGVRLSLLVPAKRADGGEYEYCGRGFRLVPGLTGAVAQWPKWYRRLWNIGQWRNYDACRVIKSRGERA